MTGSELRQLISEYGWNQKQFADHMGVHPGTIMNAVKSEKITPWKACAYYYALQNSTLERINVDDLGNRWKGSVEELAKELGLTTCTIHRLLTNRLKISVFRGYALLYAITKAEGKIYDH